MSRVEVSVIGRWRLLRDGRDISLGSQRVRALISFLALTRGQMHSRDKVARMFWAEASKEHAMGSLRQALLMLRRAFDCDEADLVLTSRSEIGFANGSLTTNFDHLVSALRDGRVESSTIGLMDGVDELLLGIDDLGEDFDQWVVATRANIRSILSEELRRALGSNAFDPASQLELAKAAYRFDEYDEEFARALMTAYTEASQVSMALRIYGEFYERLEDELGTKPSLATQDLAVKIKLSQSVARSEPNLVAIALAPHASIRLAVLPFQPLDPSSVPDFLVLGLLDEITCTLASSTAPAIISSNSTRRFLGQAPTVRQIGADLGVQYVVIGSIRTDGQQVVIAVQLVDAGTEQIVWASVYRAELAEALNIRSRIAAAIASAVAPSVHSAELSRVEGAQISDLTPFHLVLRAKDLMFRLSPDTFEAAGELLRSAIGKNPHFAQAHALSAEWFGIRVWQNWSVNPAADRRELITHAQRAVELAPGQGRSMALLGHNLVTMFRRYEEASQLFGRAVSLLPNDSETLIWTVPGLAFLGRSDDAVANAEKAISLSPYDPFQFRNHHFLSVALYAQGDYERAAAFGLACYESNPRYSSNLRMTCASLAAAGRAAEAADVARTHRLVEPEFSVSAHMSRQSFRAQAARERYARHLVEGGLPA